MGVQGLWTLITPVARPIKLETMGNKKLAIDSSIWLYQFQNAIRDREGRGLTNAHILGFLRRISKLLYYGIKPVFVFDGGAPVLKRQTITERKKRKEGGQDNLAKTAEKLLAAQLRQAAVVQAQRQAGNKDTGEEITPDTVYFNDTLAQDFADKNRVPPRGKPRKTPISPANESPKKSKYIPRDQYQLPPLRSRTPPKQADHRLATEEELSQFIEEMKPEDLDINSPHFQSLSTEMKYEIIGDLRIKSRQQNHARVEAMKLKTDQDFSQVQIMNLKQRNELTQKLLTVTDMVGKANLTIPVKIAAQRNKQYVLVKAEEGWVLGMDIEQGNSQKSPMKIDIDSDDDDDFEEVIDYVQPSTSKITAIPQEQHDVDDSDEGEFEEVAIPSTKSNGTASHGHHMTDAIRYHYGSQNVAHSEFTEPRRSIHTGSQLFHRDEVEEEEDDIMMDIAAEISAFESQSIPLRDGRVVGFSYADTDRYEVRRDLGEGSSKSHATPGPLNGEGHFENSKGTGSSQFDADGARLSPGVAIQKISNQALIPSAGLELEIDDDFSWSIPDNNNSASISHMDRTSQSELVQSKGKSRQDPLVSPTLPIKSGDPKHVSEDLDDGTSAHSSTGIQGASSNAARGDVYPSIELELADDFSALQSIRAAPSDSTSPLRLSDPVPSRASSPTLTVPYKVAIPPRDPSDVPDQGTTPTRSSDGSVDLEIMNKTPKVLLKETPTIDLTIEEAYPTSQDPCNRNDIVAGLQTSSSLQVCSTSSKTDANAPKPHTPSSFTPQRSSNLSASSKTDDSPSIQVETSTSGASKSQVDASLVDALNLEPGKCETVQKSQSGLSSGPTSSVKSIPPESNHPAILDTSTVHPVESFEHPLNADAIVGAAEMAEDVSDEQFIPWSRSPTPPPRPSKQHEPISVDVADASDPDENELHDALEAEEHALAHDLESESHQWSNFLSGLQDSENLDEMRHQADLEVNRLKAQRVKDRRDADDVNIQMSRDIQSMLRLFGIPYVISPMEAEAQCAELLTRGLVDGIITDDSDVFLFGGTRVYKNMFNQNKFVECYLMTDLEKELGLGREKLIQLAYLLGSDYTEGLAGVGPVTAMEILSEFDDTDGTSRGLEGLLGFKDWWKKVQVGKDSEKESGTTFRKKFRKKKDKLWLDDNWPNPAVAEAYRKPTVDTSDQRFTWGLPDLDGIRQFLSDHLSWASSKTDDVILPLIKRQTQRINGVAHTQGVLDSFFDYSLTDSTTSRPPPPRVASGFQSQKLQTIVQNWRQKQKEKQSQNVDITVESGPMASPQPGPSRATSKKKKNSTSQPRKKPKNNTVNQLEKTPPSPSQSKPRRARRPRKPAPEPENEQTGVVSDQESLSSEPVKPPSTGTKRPRRKKSINTDDHDFQINSSSSD